MDQFGSFVSLSADIKTVSADTNGNYYKGDSSHVRVFDHSSAANKLSTFRDAAIGAATFDMFIK